MVGPRGATNDARARMEERNSKRAEERRLHRSSRDGSLRAAGAFGMIIFTREKSFCGDE